MVLNIFWMTAIVVNMVLAVLNKKYDLLCAWGVAALALSLQFFK